MVEVGLSILLQQVVNFVVNNLYLIFLCLYLPLNFKSYSIMLSNVISEDKEKSSVSGSDSIISVLISNYPLSNGGYLVSFGQDQPDGSFKHFDPVSSLDFEASKLSKFLKFSSIFLPKGCYYLPDMELVGFISSLASGASIFEIKLLPASGQMQGLLLIRVSEDSLFKYEQEEED
ncbi:putative phage protein [Poophage MBI-2016a]|nr:putative phage protein [Poophage MBI-2016a]